MVPTAPSSPAAILSITQSLMLGLGQRGLTKADHQFYLHGATCPLTRLLLFDPEIKAEKETKANKQRQYLDLSFK